MEDLQAMISVTFARSEPQPREPAKREAEHPASLTTRGLAREFIDAVVQQNAAGAPNWHRSFGPWVGHSGLRPGNRAAAVRQVPQLTDSEEDLRIQGRSRRLGPWAGADLM
jgi:hypothetical protein